MGNATVYTITSEAYQLCYYYFSTQNQYSIAIAYGSLFRGTASWTFVAPQKYVPDGTAYSAVVMPGGIWGNGCDYQARIRYGKLTLSNGYTRGLSFDWFNPVSYTAGEGVVMTCSILFVNG